MEGFEKGGLAVMAGCLLFALDEATSHDYVALEPHFMVSASVAQNAEPVSVECRDLLEEPTYPS
jgi:hypothetical protein